jgi:hypothetical protein
MGGFLGLVGGDWVGIWVEPGMEAVQTWSF